MVDMAVLVTPEELAKQREENILKRLEPLNLGIEESELKNLVQLTREVCLRKLYPFHLDKTIEDLPKIYDSWVVRAIVSINENSEHKGILHYQENGLKVTFNEVENGIDKSLIEEIVPFGFLYL